MWIKTSGCSQESFGVYESSWIERPILARFEMAAELSPTKTAVDDGNLRLTYSELRSAVHHLARRIEEIVAPGGPVGVLLPNGAFLPCAILACLASGRICIPVDLNYPEERKTRIIRDACLA